MSTRCCIEVVQTFGNGEGDNRKSCMLYHHHDGYPEGVGYDLKRRFKPQTTFKSGWDIDCIVNELIKDQDDEYEFTAFKHGDIEYLYVINCNEQTIKCYECQWIFEDENGNLVDESKLGKEVPIP